MKCKDITFGAPLNRNEVRYEVEFSAVELDLLYEVTRKARNSLLSFETPEPRSYAAAIIALDDKLTTLFHKRRR
jgi:hypothetical protein